MEFANLLMKEIASGGDKTANANAKAKKKTKVEKTIVKASPMQRTYSSISGMEPSHHG